MKGSRTIINTSSQVWDHPAEVDLFALFILFSRLDSIILQKEKKQNSLGRRLRSARG